MLDWCILLSFVAYLALMLGIGFLFSRRQGDLGDYYLGGRRMNKWVVALSAQASDMSGWLLMGLPGAVFVGGLSEAWIGVGLLVGTYLNWRIVARGLRVYSHVCNDSITSHKIDSVGIGIGWIFCQYAAVFQRAYSYISMKCGINTIQTVAGNNNCGNTCFQSGLMSGYINAESQTAHYSEIRDFPGQINYDIVCQLFSSVRSGTCSHD